MKRGRKPGANNKGRVASMMLQGFSVGRIAEELGITHASVRRICAQLCICVACGRARVTNALSEGSDSPCSVSIYTHGEAIAA